MARLIIYSGIYTITNILNNKIYVGYASDIFGRLDTHKSDLVNNKHPNTHLQNSFNKYGVDNFLFELLEECEKEFLSSNENWWCKMLDSHNPKYGYNIGLTGPKGNTSLSKESVRKRTETRKKNSEIRGYWVPIEYVEKLKTTKKGKPCHPLMVINSIKVTSRPCEQLTKDDEFVAEFPSIREAGRQCGINSKNINTVCLGKRLTTGGFKWRYKK